MNQCLNARLRHAIETAEMPTYVYSYPSKRAYRKVDPAPTIVNIWDGASGKLNLYLHIPFCAYRCSFCTLFMTTAPSSDLVGQYLQSLHRQINMYGELLGHMEIESVYIGGGTPTVLSAQQFEHLFQTIRASFPNISTNAEISVEGSPDTISVEILSTLNALGVNRISMGLQTLVPEEMKRCGRRYQSDTLISAINAINNACFENVNYDLIYGLEGQTRESWFRSLDTTIELAPDTITVYPVVFRPLTGIDKKLHKHQLSFMSNGEKYAIYDETVEHLREQGFYQNSFVRFSKCAEDGLRQEAADFSGVPLLGLGVSARSYTDKMHYSTEFSVRKSNTDAIIADFIDYDHRSDGRIQLGFNLDQDEQRRRFCILNLSLGRLDQAKYEQRFGDFAAGQFQNELQALTDEGCVVRDEDGSWNLTAKGFKYSNVIATLFKSDRVQQREQQFEPV